MASLSKPGSKIRILKSKESKKKHLINNQRKSTSTSTHNLEKIHKDFLFRNFKYEESSSKSDYLKKEEHHYPYRIGLGESFGANSTQVKEQKNPFTGSLITNYLDLNIIEQYTEREIIYGKILQKNRKLLVKLEIVTFCLKKYIILKVKK